MPHTCAPAGPGWPRELGSCIVRLAVGGAIRGRRGDATRVEPVRDKGRGWAWLATKDPGAAESRGAEPAAAARQPHCGGAAVSLPPREPVREFAIAVFPDSICLAAKAHSGVAAFGTVVRRAVAGEGASSGTGLIPSTVDCRSMDCFTCLARDSIGDGGTTMHVDAAFGWAGVSVHCCSVCAVTGRAVSGTDVGVTACQVASDTGDDPRTAPLPDEAYGVGIAAGTTPCGGRHAGDDPRGCLGGELAVSSCDLTLLRVESISSPQLSLLPHL
mmetsp:Transcript_120629/g.341726  ORF Transcript_120629/g.341726 Transcript_120629/m.341726 type:complete len:272 (-) Transcript_120629:411-1226(-)